MKKLLKNKFVLIAAFLFFCSFLMFNKLKAQGGAGVAISYQTFYDDLSPYGTWIDYPTYGQVWHPRVTGDFRPYLTNGYWDYSDAGWLWMSNYDWGWAPFHYGRWVYDDFYGWLWVPGYDWSPAWVTWGYFGDNYCWAPIMPGINVGIAFGSYRPHSYYWNAVPRNHIYDRDLYRREVPREDIRTRVNNITVINNFSTTKIHNQYYSKGPDVKEVEKYTSRNIKPAIISERSTAGPAKREGDKVAIYRPSVNTPQPKEFRRTDKDHVQPLLGNQESQSGKEGNQQTLKTNEQAQPSMKGNEHAQQPLKTNEQTQQSLKTNDQAQRSIRENEQAPPSVQKNEQTQQSIKANEAAPRAMNENERRNNPAPVRNFDESRQMNRQEAPIRNDQMEQRENIERLPIYHSPPASFGNRGGGSRRRF